MQQITTEEALQFLRANQLVKVKIKEDSYRGFVECPHVKGVDQVIALKKLDGLTEIHQ